MSAPTSFGPSRLAELPLSPLDAAHSAVQNEGMPAPSSSTAALVDGLGMARRVRAFRRVESTNLTMLGVDALVIGLSILATGSQFSEWIQVLTVPVVFLAL